MQHIRLFILKIKRLRICSTEYRMDFMAVSVYFVISVQFSLKFSIYHFFFFIFKRFAFGTSNFSREQAFQYKECRAIKTIRTIPIN